MLRRIGSRYGKRFSFFCRNVRAVSQSEKAERGGEDAFLSLPNVQAVLDGVSWWKENADLNAGLYSAALARCMYEYVEDELLGDAPASSFRLLERGYESCKHSDVLGTCTALVATLQEPQEDIQSRDHYELVLLDGPSLPIVGVSSTGGLLAATSAASAAAAATAAVAAADDTMSSTEAAKESASDSDAAVTRVKTTIDLHQAFARFQRTDSAENYLLDVVYVGDCTMMLIRNGRVCYVTEEQAHQLDYPYQLGTGSNDTPKDGVRLLIPVEKGDIVVMGTDGIFDNLYPHRIVELIWPHLERVFSQHGYLQALGGAETAKAPANAVSYVKNRNLRTLLDDIMAALDMGANAVMADAMTVSRDVRCDSPYASKCIENGALFEGGKPDDMTLLISVIGESDDGEPSEQFSGSETAFPLPYRDWP
ncbi:conserved hypothetical protein [Leishmania major strain Friedlin]|uniref:Protein phosphatase n=1 Tax=Leishmania major TaxID=5664 RepID=E9AD96_LEIMA|nr:conserved hypothetical protein [Leishmania major strain Friedlin]CAG9576722.1 hypothetical_protein_-_conserved [Leishmania major strain Friedlin]CBZ12182.1 conserved hypothetical protein [Leishmania major strain Friedlin]|eukprot:XP_003721925.1 conserved hypothetical protein [Leishmania major strain Friedlin]